MSCGCGPDRFDDPMSGGVKLAGLAVVVHVSNRMTGGIACGGSATVGTNQTWDGFSQVFHLIEDADGTPGEYRDSCGGPGGTGGLNPRTPARTLGPYTFAQEHDGTDYVVIPKDAMSDETDLTVSVWVRPTNDFLSRAVYGRGRTSVLDGHGWSVELGHDERRRPYASVQTVDAEGLWHVRTVTASQPMTKGCWFHLTMTFDHANLKLYVDGVLSATRPVTETRLAPSSGSSAVGRRDNVKYLQGDVAEVRVSPVARSAAWLAAEAASVCDTAFYGTQVSTPTGA